MRLAPSNRHAIPKWGANHWSSSPFQGFVVSVTSFHRPDRQTQKGEFTFWRLPDGRQWKRKQSYGRPKDDTRKGNRGRRTAAQPIVFFLTARLFFSSFSFKGSTINYLSSFPVVEPDERDFLCNRPTFGQEKKKKN